MQVKPRKFAWISLDSFGGIWPFQRVTREKNKKILPASTRVSGCAQNASNPIFLPFPLAGVEMKERGAQLRE
jgi:hypothetical protein